MAKTKVLLATCHTDGCGNQGISIPLDFLLDDVPLAAVICGACHEPITDVK